MADRTTIALALLLAITTEGVSAAPSPYPPMPRQDRSGAGINALPLDLALGGRGDVPSLALVLGGEPDRKVAGLGPSVPRLAPATRPDEAELSYLAIALSALALSWVGPARRQAAYRWMVRR
ncbi:hypothetical protein [Jannaschia formosa]|uniref:hypothetical protein n=1 Tax=Jannaschia formosa TaxID=2259592 RepID=UPI000E1C2339|nr:hypothetical protein [Jannaschia formosa]TFL19373.1 hypothetical protein DR046_05470 [Jannaschia formosa]